VAVGLDVVRYAQKLLRFNSFGESVFQPDFRAAADRARLFGRFHSCKGLRASGAYEVALSIVPLAHPPGHAQVDFGECDGVIGWVRTKTHVLCFELPQSDVCYIEGYPAETTVAFLDGHVSAFAFLGG
jgi:prepilin-type processing-associated H-X9-DG protein